MPYFNARNSALLLDHGPYKVENAATHIPLQSRMIPPPVIFWSRSEPSIFNLEVPDAGLSHFYQLPRLVSTCLSRILMMPRIWVWILGAGRFGVKAMDSHCTFEITRWHMWRALIGFPSHVAWHLAIQISRRIYAAVPFLKEKYCESIVLVGIQSSRHASWIDRQEEGEKLYQSISKQRGPSQNGGINERLFILCGTNNNDKQKLNESL